MHCKPSIATCVGTQLFFVAMTALGNGVGLVTSVFWTRLTKLFVAFDFKKMCIKRGIDLKELKLCKGL